MNPERRARMLDLISIRSEKNKVGVPKDRWLISPEQASALRDCEDAGWLTWIDSEKHPAFGWRDLDIYLVTPAGRLALSGGSDDTR